MKGKQLIIVILTACYTTGYGMEQAAIVESDAKSPSYITVSSDKKNQFYDTSLSADIISRTRKRRINQGGVQRVGGILYDALKDVFILNKNLFTWSSFKVIATTFPIFIGARMLDERLQSCFYDASCHKNINQFPDWCHTVAKVSIGVPIVFLGSDVFFSKDPDKQYTAQILLVGMPFVIWTKTLIKKIEFDACKRPWNEHFSCEERSNGGFPSGHMAQAFYMTMLYGMRYGPAYAAPLGALSAFIGVTFISCNRHYISQLIAGAAFGTLYALAASKLVDMKMTKHVKLGMKVDDIGRPTFSLAVNW